LELLGRGPGAQADEPQIDFARFEDAKLLGGRQVEQVERNVRKLLPKGAESPGQQIEVEMSEHEAGANDLTPHGIRG
jgi:hypothetical protein